MDSENKDILLAILTIMLIIFICFGFWQNARYDNLKEARTKACDDKIEEIKITSYVTETLQENGTKVFCEYRLDDPMFDEVCFDELSIRMRMMGCKYVYLDYDGRVACRLFGNRGDINLIDMGEKVLMTE